MKEIASELAQRAKPAYVKQRAKEAVVRKSIDIKDRVVASPIALGVVGGLLTAGIAKLLLGRRDRAVAGATMGAMGDKVGAEIKRTARAVGEQAERAVARAGAYAGDEPIVTALGAVAVGAALGFLIPLTDRERRTLEPYREQVSDKLEALHTDVSDAVKEKVDALHDKIVGEEEESQPSPQNDLMFPKS